MRISDWSSDVCSSDLCHRSHTDGGRSACAARQYHRRCGDPRRSTARPRYHPSRPAADRDAHANHHSYRHRVTRGFALDWDRLARGDETDGSGKDPGSAVGRNEEAPAWITKGVRPSARSEEHTSELQSLMRISYAVFGLKK